MFDRAERGAQGELSSTARDLSVLARHDARLAVSVRAEGGYDTNTDQFPDRSGPNPSGNLLYGGMASALVRPLGERGPYAVAGARLRSFPNLAGYDVGWAGGAAGFRFERGRDELKVEYAYDGILLGYQPFSSAHQLQLDGTLDLPFARLSALASARAETYLTLEKYSGPTFDGELALGWGGSRQQFWLRYRAEVHRSQDVTVAWLDHGPGARALTSFPSGRLVVDVQVTARTYGAEDPGFNDTVRQDVYLDGAVSLEQDLGRQLSLYLSIGGRKAFSNVSANNQTLDYTRLYGSAGVIFTAGLW
jgi:hypothetical protein